MEQLKYPIGRVNIPNVITFENINQWITEIENFPLKLEKLVAQLSEEQLNTPYREGGWTVRQTIHHCGDSHVQSYVRFKWALTEDNPIIKAYFEDRWASLFDTEKGPIEFAFNFLKAVHDKWVYLLKGLSEKELLKTFVHPESGDTISLQQNICIYAWHCKHHFAHIENLLKRENWLNHE